MNYIQYPVINHNGKEYEKDITLYIYLYLFVSVYISVSVTFIYISMYSSHIAIQKKLNITLNQLYAHANSPQSCPTLGIHNGSSSFRDY